MAFLEEGLINIKAERQKGNDYFRQGKVPEAINTYEQAVAYILAQKGGAEKPLELRFEDLSLDTFADTELSLLCFNLGVAKYKLRRYAEAVEWLEKALKIRPTEKAQAKLVMAYLKVGEYQGALKAYEGLKGKFTEVDKCMEECVNREIESLYISLPECSFEYTPFEDPFAFYRKLAALCQSGAKVPIKAVISILRDGYARLSNLDNLVHVTGRAVYVFGDTHGQFLDTLGVLESLGLTDKFDTGKKYVFNGDFVDRGPASVENFLLILTLFILYPQNVYLNRGNHEFMEMNRVMGFYDELRKKYPFYAEGLFDCFLCVFSVLPICTVINEAVFVVHGGLPEEELSLESIFSINRKVKSGMLDKRFEGLMWSDPADIEHHLPSRRGIGVVFGRAISRRFMEMNGIRLIVRSHEYTRGGYKTEHDGKVVTIFSAPNYCLEMNTAAFLEFDFCTDKVEYKVVTFDVGGVILKTE